MNEVIDKDLGWKEFKKNLKKLNKSYTKAGFPSEKDIKENGLLVSEIAIYNQFGTFTKSGSVHIPARPFMSLAFDKNKAKIDKLIKLEYDKLISRKTKEAGVVKKSLSLIGEFMTGLIKKEITTLKTPPNKPITIAMKKSSNPLIDTGRMRASVTHVEKIVG